jgi:hypothetical protein
MVTLANLDTGNSFRFGQLDLTVIAKSFDIKQHEFTVRR